MNQEKLLWKLQEFKQDEAKLLKNEASNLLLESLRELKERIKSGEEQISLLHNEIEEDNNRSMELEKRIKSLNDQIKEGKEKLYSTEPESMKELIALQQSVQKLECQSEERENIYLELLEKTEACEKKETKLKEVSKSWKMEYNKSIRKYKKMKIGMDLKLAEVKCKQEEIIEQLTPEVKKIYQDVEKRFSINFVALLKKNSCTGCHIEVSDNLIKQVKSGKGYYFCDNCGRILLSSV